MDTIAKHAEQLKRRVTLSPTNSGDGLNVIQAIEDQFKRFDLKRHEKKPHYDTASHALFEAKRWCIDVAYNTGRGLVLWSSAEYGAAYGAAYGNGKTLLAKCAYNALSAVLLTELGLPDHGGQLITTEGYKDGILGSYNDHTTAEYIREFRRARFLILDDFGTEAVKSDSLPWWQEQLYKIFNYAYDTRQPLLITSNLTPDQLMDWIGGKNWSRLDGLCGGDGFINMSGIPDQRQAQ